MSKHEETLEKILIELVTDAMSPPDALGKNDTGIFIAHELQVWLGERGLALTGDGLKRIKSKGEG